MSIHSKLIKIAKDHGFSYRIDSGIFYVGIEYTSQHNEPGIEWTPIQRVSDLLARIGY